MTSLWPLLLPVAAATGWILARFPKRAPARDKPFKLSQDYFKGLNYLLNEQDDKAVEIFIRLIEVDSDTVETHLALGSLFRRRGEVDRAIRVHQNLIARPQLTTEQRIDALLALGRDYMRAGVLDRAERILQEVVSMDTVQSSTGLYMLLDIFQQEKAWEKAIKVAENITRISSEDLRGVIAHHYCELTDIMLSKGQINSARKLLKHAMSIDSNSVRASLILADIEAKQNRYKAAIKAYKRIKLQDPDYLSETIGPLVTCYEQLGDEQGCVDYLSETLRDHPRIAIILELAEKLRQHDSSEVANDFMAAQISKYPSIRGLSKLIQWHLESAEGKVRDKLSLLHQLTLKLLESKPVYQCVQCGYSVKTLLWYCPGCKVWSSIRPIHGLVGD